MINGLLQACNSLLGGSHRVRRSASHLCSNDITMVPKSTSCLKYKIQTNYRIPSNSEVTRLMRGNLPSPAEGCALKQIPPSTNTVMAIIQIPFGWCDEAKTSYCTFHHLQFVSIVTRVSCIARSCGRQNVIRGRNFERRETVFTYHRP